jgi:hypothetical protein
VPTGSGLVSVVMSSTSAQMCSGTMKLCRTLSCFTNTELLKVTSTVLPSTVISSNGMFAGLITALSFMRLSVKAMSSAVKSSPSFHFTPSRAVSLTLL